MLVSKVSQGWIAGAKIAPKEENDKMLDAAAAAHVSPDALRTAIEEL